MKRFYAVFVTIFWLIMMGFLFQRDVLPAFVINNPVGYKINLTQDCPVRESWMGIYFKDKRIGFSNSVISQDVEDGVSGYRIDETSLLRLKMLGEKKFIRIKGSSFFSEDYLLKNFSYNLAFGEQRLDVSGAVTGRDIRLTMDIGGYKKEEVIRLDQGTLISNTVSPMLLFKKFDTNKEITFDIFNPVTFGTQRARIVNIGKELMEFGGKGYEVNIFETDISGIKTKTWMTLDGDILKEESMLGLTMYKQGPESALDIAGTLSFEAQDLALEFSISPNVEILNPRGVSYLKIYKDSDVVEIFRDNGPHGEDVLSIPIENIQDEDFIYSSDDRIIGLARQIIGNEKDSWVACRKILHWVYNNIEKVPTLSVPSSLDVLHMKQGDCNEHTVLFTALTRSVGIPTKMVAGLVYLDEGFYYHAWPKVYIGEWVNMDPTLGQEIADATHIPLLEGGLKDQIELIRIIGNLKIKIIDYR